MTLFKKLVLILLLSAIPSFAGTVSTTIITGQSVTSTFTTPFVALTVPNNGTGSLIAKFNGVTGAPFLCSESVTFGGLANVAGDVLTEYGSAGASTIITSLPGSPATGTHTYATRISLALSGPTAGLYLPYSTISVKWGCPTYPTGGTVTLEFVPDVSGTWQGYQSYYQASNESFLVWAIPGVLHTLTVMHPGPGSQVTIYDSPNGDCSSPVNTIGTLDTTQLGTYTFDASFSTGLCIVTSGDSIAYLTVTFR